MKKIVSFLIAFFFIQLSILAQDNNRLVVIGDVPSILHITMADPETIDLLNENDDVITTKAVSNALVISNQAAWKMSISSSYAQNQDTGRLKLDDGETYIPYLFAIKDGDTVVVSRFAIQSAAQQKTASSGELLTLYLTFLPHVGIIWPMGIYHDTITISLLGD
ncbi:MAG: hypothetical protein NT061_09365 [Spirochaetes bacterium]|nr:hypothetical protein [Spirochaetota bacterium]